MPREGEVVVVRQGRSIAVVGVFLIGCAVFLMAGASGVLADDSCRGCIEGPVTPSASASPTPVPLGGTGGPTVLLPAAALLLGSGILTYVILRRR